MKDRGSLKPTIKDAAVVRLQRFLYGRSMRFSVLKKNRKLAKDVQSL